MAHDESVSTPSNVPPSTVLVHSGVDQVLTTHGAYIPVELLLAQGYLRYADYEAWRSGTLASLQGALRIPAQQTEALLAQAAAWAERLGLRAERQVYHGWGGAANRVLAFVNDAGPATETLLATHYVRPAVSAAGGQFDLFLDSGGTAALQDARAALGSRDAATAAQALARLSAAAPRHALRPAIQRLVEALRYLAAPLAPADAETELDALEHGLTPAAAQVLGGKKRDFLAPFWQRLARALADQPFDARRPALHASYAYLNCLDFERAAAAIEAVPDYAIQPALLARLADARRRDGARTAAIGAWCALCWAGPRIAEAVLNDSELADTRIRDAWHGFIDLDLEPTPDTELFPAWLLLAEPGLARVLPTALAASATPGEAAFRAMRRLLQRDDASNRKALHDTAPWLLPAYLSRRAPNDATATRHLCQ